MAALQSAMASDVCVGPGVKHNASPWLEAVFLQTVNEVAFMVALEIVDSHAGICLAQFVENGVDAFGAVNFRFANAKQVQVGPVYYGYVLHCCLC